MRKLIVFLLIIEDKSKSFGIELSRIGGFGSFQMFNIELVKFGVKLGRLGRLRP